MLALPQCRPHSHDVPKVSADTAGPTGQQPWEPFRDVPDTKFPPTLGTSSRLPADATLRAVASNPYGSTYPRKPPATEMPRLGRSPDSPHKARTTSRLGRTATTRANTGERELICPTASQGPGAVLEACQRIRGSFGPRPTATRLLTAGCGMDLTSNWHGNAACSKVLSDRSVSPRL